MVPLSLLVKRLMLLKEPPDLIQSNNNLVKKYIIHLGELPEETDTLDVLWLLYLR